ncbi:MAG: hypothetical protein AAF702_32170 [Chloroflexota bacterium]
MDIQLQGAGEPETQLASYPKAKGLLLVIDNLEHLLDSAELLVALLRAAPNLRMLVTTR